MELRTASTAQIDSARPWAHCAYCRNGNQCESDKPGSLSRRGSAVVGRYAGYTYEPASRVYCLFLSRRSRYPLSAVYHRWVAANTDVSSDAGVFTPAAEPCAGRDST